jgi:hypothetical protein
VELQQLWPGNLTGNSNAPNPLGFPSPNDALLIIRDQSWRVQEIDVKVVSVGGERLGAIASRRITSVGHGPHILAIR